MGSMVKYLENTAYPIVSHMYMPNFNYSYVKNYRSKNYKAYIKKSSNESRTQVSIFNQFG